MMNRGGSQILDVDGVERLILQFAEAVEFSWWGTENAPVNGNSGLNNRNA